VYSYRITGWGTAGVWGRRELVLNLGKEVRQDRFEEMAFRLRRTQSCKIRSGGENT
jgi:hypothetical protein